MTVRSPRPVTVSGYFPAGSLPGLYCGTVAFLVAFMPKAKAQDQLMILVSLLLKHFALALSGCLGVAGLLPFSQAALKLSVYE